VTAIPWTVANPGLQLPITLRISIANQPLRAATSVTLGIFGASDGLPSATRRSSARARLVVGSARQARVPARPGAAGGGPRAHRSYDVTGRLIRTLVDETLPRERAVAVDGLDAQGRRRPAGCISRG